MKHVSTSLAHNKAQGDLFDWSIKRRTHSLVFVNVFTRRGYIFSQISRAVARFIFINPKEQADEADRAMGLLVFSFLFSQCESGWSEYSEDDKYQKEMKNKYNKRVEPD